MNLESIFNALKKLNIKNLKIELKIEDEINLNRLKNFLKLI
jgi:hypothetical protein